ncbi:hypothetical protein [Persephonella sp.]|uniref:hypothetical protein n=1 Tax=Persephonella sp. TaxID=2060922 RepID=UPI0025E477C2|nr:hypothetical protein [Persephonella sp.]
MLSKEEENFVESRNKIQKIATPFIIFLIFLWICIYIVVIFNYPFLVKIQMDADFPEKLLPVFYNLFMVVLLIMYVFMLISLKIEKEYIQIIKKLKEEKSPEKGA